MRSGIRFGSKYKVLHYKVKLNVCIIRKFSWIRSVSKLIISTGWVEEKVVYIRSNTTLSSKCSSLFILCEEIQQSVRSSPGTPPGKVLPNIRIDLLWITFRELCFVEWWQLISCYVVTYSHKTYSFNKRISLKLHKPELPLISLPGFFKLFSSKGCGKAGFWGAQDGCVPLGIFLRSGAPRGTQPKGRTEILQSRDLAQDLFAKTPECFSNYYVLLWLNRLYLICWHCFKHLESFQNQPPVQATAWFQNFMC